MLPAKFHIVAGRGLAAFNLASLRRDGFVVVGPAQALAKQFLVAAVNGAYARISQLNPHRFGQGEKPLNVQPFGGFVKFGV